MAIRANVANIIVTASPIASKGPLVNIEAPDAITAETRRINQRGSIIVCLTESNNLGRGASGLVLGPKCLLLLKRSLSSPMMPDYFKNHYKLDILYNRYNRENRLQSESYQ